MVGHTHCDIDAVFGRLWKHMRNRAVLSPLEYARVIEESLTTNNYQTKVKDIFIVPDYVRTYRAYSADDVIEIVQKKENNDANPQNLLLQQHHNEHDTKKLIPVQVFNKWYPEETKDEPEGMYIMQKLPPPDRVLVPQEFISDSRSVFFATFKKVKETFQATQPEVVLQWEQFAQKVPLNNSAEDYLRSNPESMHIPFKNLLFSMDQSNNIADDSNNPSLAEYFQSKKRKQTEEIVQLRSTDSIAWSRRNKKLRKDDPNEDLRVAKDCALACYIYKKKSSEQPTTATLNRQRKLIDKSKSQKQTKSKKHSESGSDGEEEDDYSEEDDDDDDDSYDNVALNYSSDVEKVDGNNYYHKRRNIQVKLYGSSALPYIGKIFQFVNSSLTGTIAAVVSKADDPSNQLYFKFYDHKTHQICPDPYKACSDDSQKTNWQYIKCNELMGSKKTIKWEGGNPASVGDSLVGRHECEKTFQNQKKTMAMVQWRGYKIFER
eukprot:gene13206-17696_t